MAQTKVTSKNIKTLTRRLKYLESLVAEGSANSYDLAEVNALKNVLTFIESNSEEPHE